MMTLAAIGAAVIMASSIFMMSGFRMRATAAEEASYKYYTSVTVAYGQSFEDVAEQYFDAAHYKDLGAYEKELCSINHFYSMADAEYETDPGDHLIVPYYSTEFR